VDPVCEKRYEAPRTIANYALGYALHAGAARGNPIRIVRLLFAYWPGDRKPSLLIRRTRALVLAGMAFHAYRSGQWKEAATMAIASLASTPVQAGNRGLLAVAGRSILHLMEACIRKKRCLGL